MTHYYTGNPLGSTDPRDLFDNAQNFDSAINGNAKTWKDRFGVDRYTWKGALDNIAPLGKPWTLQEAQTAISAGEIADGAYFFVWSDDKNSVADVYQNVGGVATKTGKSYPSSEFISELDARTKNQTLSGGFFNGMSITSAAADIDGVCIYLTVENGDVYVATKTGMVSSSANAVVANKSLSYGFYNGIPAIQLTTDAEGKIISLFTAKGESVSNGDLLIDIEYDFGGQSNTLCYGFVGGRPAAKVVVDIKTGAISEIVSSSGDIYTYNNNLLIKLTDIGNDTGGVDRGFIYSGKQKSYLGQASSYSEPNSNIIYIFIDEGQSNSWGQGSGGIPTIAGNPIYPGNALMLNTGVRAVSTKATSLVPLIETQNGQLSETSCSSWVNHTIRDVEALTGVMPTIVAINASLGGQQYYQLTRGQDTYKRFQIALQSATDLIINLGKRPVVAAFRWMQGENEVDIQARTKQEYESQLRQLQRFKTDDVKMITGQHEDPVFFINQISWPSTYPEGLWRQPIKEAQLLRTERILPVGPIYQYPMSDHIHMNSWGRNYLGQCLAIATVNEVFGASSTPMTPCDYYFIGDNVLRVKVSVQYPPLIIDTSGIISMDGLDNYGFDFDDYTEFPPEITGVSLVSADVIEVTLNKKPARSWRLAYAMKKSDIDRAGPITGARGCLRDSSGHKNIYDNAVTTFNFCPSFIINSK